MKEFKMLRQNIESRRRVEQFRDEFEEETGISLSLSQAEARLTKIALEKLEGDSDD